MKMIKLIIAAVAIYVSADQMQAQEVKIPADNNKEWKLILINFKGDLPIEAYNGKEVIISSTSEPVTVPERAKGLKPVNPGGTDNTGIGLEYEKSGNQITVTCLLPLTKHGEYKIRIPDNMALKYESPCERGGTVTVTGVKGEVEIKTCHSIVLKDVSGPLVLSTIAGNVDVVYSAGMAAKPGSISSIGGEIDITLPAKAGINLELKSLSGNIYSDFDFPQVQSKNMRQVGGNNFKYQLNGGGTDLNLVSISGNIYIRKGK